MTQHTQADLAEYLASLTLQEKEEFLRDGMSQMDSRAREALAIYRPMPKQLGFHLSEAPERILRGGKRSGKTVCASAELASAATGASILGPDGTPLPYKYPRRPLLIWIIGWDEAHIGQTLYRYLFKPGYLRTIRDDITGQWRMWNPADPVDQSREDETKPAGPFIPPRLVNQKTWVWDKARGGIFDSVELYNGTKICAYPSTARQAKQGDAVDLIWIDEDIANPEHLREWQDRLADRRGRMFWSVWPHSQNDALLKLHQRAEDGDDKVHETVLRFTDNPFITPEAKEEAWARMATDEERRARDYGEFMFDKVLMYQWNVHLHGLPYHESVEDLLSAVYREHGDTFPESWPRYLGVDPGFSTQAGLIAVVPPPEKYGKRIIIEDEVYLRRKDCHEFARSVADKAAGKFFEAFIGDWHAMRMTPMAGGPTIGEQYAQAFERAGLRSRASGSHFLPGSDDVGGRTARVRDWMRSGEGGPVVRVVTDRCPNTVAEFKKYKRRITRDEVSDAPIKGNDHAMDALAYLAMYDPEYVLPAKTGQIMPPKLRAFYDLMATQEPSGQQTVSLGPPSMN